MNRFFRFLIKRQYARQRAIDLQILWPCCKEAAPDLDTAKTVFLAHAYHDRAWLVLGINEITRQVNALK